MWGMSQTVSSLQLCAKRTFFRTLPRNGSLDLTNRFLSEGSDSIHSTDIAFKPAESGWGFTNKYDSNYDKIFGKKDDSPTKDGEENPKTLAVAED
eukprot:CAMPEP_0113534864 /NCGR_PEP_ID=MMETSP0015_2-20120614/5385_1 /TAXON_ID=2838 /ORGANISM="Odontella" /LENGTH=94 /DNA_ID=CAMNT_0000434051 /DNA_START=215 /DNA_END=499 /DNA_ORIENTATION=- /assembly_acc=CAM_ASM_000160